MIKPKSNACVAVSENGPYIITGDVPLAEQTIGADAEGGSETWKEGESFPYKRPTRYAGAELRGGSHSATEHT
jgi:hypothetical protein